MAKMKPSLSLTIRSTLNYNRKNPVSFNSVFINLNEYFPL